MQVLLQSRADETELGEAGAEGCPLIGVTQELHRLNGEIRALYKAALPPAVIHQISRGARDQALIGKMMVDDCRLRADDGTLNEAHVANAEQWIASVHSWIEKRKAVYAFNCRRKLFVIRSRR